LTQVDVAGRIGVTQSDLSRIENGEYKVGLDTLFKILQVFEMSMSHFFEEPAEVPEGVGVEEGLPASDEEHLLSDWAELSADARHDVREFIAFKKMQQESRQPRWKPEDRESGDGNDGDGREGNEA
jgi:transcriptional regulator with XRE-family HTH domain